MTVPLARQWLRCPQETSSLLSPPRCVEGPMQRWFLLINWAVNRGRNTICFLRSIEFLDELIRESRSSGRKTKIVKWEYEAFHKTRGRFYLSQATSLRFITATLIVFKTAAAAVNTAALLAATSLNYGDKTDICDNGYIVDTQPSVILCDQTLR